MRWVVSACLLFALAACGGHALNHSEDGRACTSDADCSEGESCDLSDGSKRRSQAMRPTCPSPNPKPCPSTGCGQGEACKPVNIYGCPSMSSCGADCSSPDATPCDSGFVCRPSGYCEAIRCDDPEYTGCPTGMTCDAAATMPDSYPGRYSLYGTDQYPEDFERGPMLSAQQEAAIAARCVFLRCNESGSFDCRDGFRCDVERAEPLSSGCLPIPCAELGRCSSDAFICEPTSIETRPALVDAHGCVSKNCEEGAVCPESTECDFTRPGTSAGCAYIRCDEPNGSCPREGTKCDPEPAPLPSGVTPEPDIYGCVPRHCAIDGIECPEGAECDPENPSSLATGCVWVPEPPDAGAGGSGGMAGFGGSGSFAGSGALGGTATGGSAPTGSSGTTNGELGVCR